MNEQAVDQAIRVLNEALEADPQAINQLFDTFVVVNGALVDHPSIQVGAVPESPHFWLSPLGLINGLFGADHSSWGFIAANVDESGNILSFGRTPGK